MLFAETLDGPIRRDDNISVGKTDDEDPFVSRLGRKRQAL